MASATIAALRGDSEQQFPALGGQQGGPVFGGQYEQMATVLAAQVKAQVEARYVMALRKPRNWDDVRSAIVKECKRPSFAADKSAYYKKPIGEGAEGLGIRFAEMALAKMTNFMVETSTVYEDENRETVRVTVTDLEGNGTWHLDVRITKTVERSKPMDDGFYVSVRKNSRGVMTYTVPATDEDLLNKRGALISKAARTLALRIIPGDIQAEAEELIKATRKDTAAKDPDGERRRIIDAFAELGIRAEDLAQFLGKPLDQCLPAELVELRSYYAAIEQGDTTWPAVMEFQAEGQRKQQDGAKAASERAARKTASDAAKKDKGDADKKDATGAPKTGEPAATAATPPPAAAATETAKPNANAPTLKDALAAVRRGDDEVAHDIARGLGAEGQAAVEAAIAERDGGTGALE